MGFFIRTYLNKLRDVSYETRDVDGTLEECIVIPMRRNGIRKTDKGSVFMNLAMNDKLPNAYNQTHYISVLADEDIMKEVKALGYEDRFKYFGFAKLVRNNKRSTDFSGRRVSLDTAMETD